MNDEYVAVQQEKAGKVPLTVVMEEGTKRMQEAVERCMDMLGSTGKASGLLKL
jgi:fructose-bisphosphate aldolase class II